SARVRARVSSGWASPMAGLPCASRVRSSTGASSLAACLVSPTAVRRSASSQRAVRITGWQGSTPAAVRLVTERKHSAASRGSPSRAAARAGRPRVQPCAGGGGPFPAPLPSPAPLRLAPPLRLPSLAPLRIPLPPPPHAPPPPHPPA